MSIKAQVMKQLILLYEVEALKDEYNITGREGIPNGRNKGMGQKGQAIWENELACLELYIQSGMSQWGQVA